MNVPFFDTHFLHGVQLSRNAKKNEGERDH